MLTPVLTRRSSLIALGGAGLALAGCAGMNSVTVDVASYGDWPAQRHPGTYAFERLPSQAAQAERHAPVEASAKAALEKAGFVAAAAGQAPDVLVQVGARLTRSERSPWDEPFWWRGGWGVSAWHRGPWLGPRSSFWMGIDSTRYEREVALLLRDRASGAPVYEARASLESYSRGGEDLVRAMFEAALSGFPATDAKPRRVTVAL
jgi:hypothetical protein